MKPYLLLSAAIGAGGEFLTCLLYSHDSLHWPFMAHCHTYHYTKILHTRRPYPPPIMRSHCPDFYVNNGIREIDTQRTTDWAPESLDYKMSIMPYLKQVTLDYPLSDLKEFRKCRAKTQSQCVAMGREDKLRDWYDSHDLLSNSGFHVDYFNPLNNYYDLCNYLEMEPSMDHWIKSWRSYLSFGFAITRGTQLNNKYREALAKL